MITLIDIGQSHENRTLLVMKVSYLSVFPFFMWTSDNRKTEPVGIEDLDVDRWRNSRKRVDLAGDCHVHCSRADSRIRERCICCQVDGSYRLLHSTSYESRWLRVLERQGAWIRYQFVKFQMFQNRMWRKNRSPAKCHRQHFSTVCCSGVDLNRNFDWFWACEYRISYVFM